jgi:opacity protein-like surface antigen
MRNRFIKILSAFILTFTFSLALKAQELDFDKMLNEDVVNVNPVYKPVIGIGVGYLGFMGDVKNTNGSPMIGSLGYKLNVSMFIDGPKRFKLNAFTMLTIGNSGITVNQSSYKDPSQNLNFQSNLIVFGFNVHYDFEPLFSKASFLKPFISIGVESIKFSSRTDLTTTAADGTTQIIYNYWPDGTIRDRAYSEARGGNIIKRDFDYETELRSSNYSQNTFGIPIDLGVDFNVSNRTTIRFGYSYNYTFSDYIDDSKGDSKTDKFTYSYVSLHLDLFSDPKMLKMHRLFLELDAEDFSVMYGDEDNDGVYDVMDQCLLTPKDVAVDTAGCPFDDDRDGVPNFKDKDVYSNPGAIVDLNGVEIPDNIVWDNLNLDGLSRDQVEMYLTAMNNMAAGGSRRLGQTDIPEKFKTLDEDKDGYISFDEVLKAIDSFFDFESELSTQDIYELNDFFFAQ